MTRMFSRWKVGNLKQYLFFKKVILENEFSHMFIEANYIIKIGKISVVCRKPELKIIILMVQLFPLCRPNLCLLTTTRLKC